MKILHCIFYAYYYARAHLYTSMANFCVKMLSHYSGKDTDKFLLWCDRYEYFIKRAKD